MGRDKAKLPFPLELPMALEVARSMRTAGLTPLLARHTAEEPWGAPWGLVPVVADPAGPRHPLRGLLAVPATDVLVVAACDMPFLTARTIRRLLPVHAAADRQLLFSLRWDQAAIQRVRALVEHGGRVRELTTGMRRVSLEGRELSNINRPSDATT